MGSLIEIVCLRFIRGQHPLTTCTIKNFTRNLFTSSPQLTREYRKFADSRTKTFINKHVSTFKDRYLNHSKETTKAGAELSSTVNKNGEKVNGDFRKPPGPDVPEVAVKEGIFTRFKNTYKQHGKIFVGVHLVTSSFWVAIFYSAVISGVDISAFLKWLGVGETVLQKLNSPSLGHIATTYLLYKVATPLRYTLTVAGTRYVVKHFQSSGRMPLTPERNKISSLIKEGGVNMKKRKFTPKRYR